MTDAVVDRLETGTPAEFEPRLHEHRAELTGYCYRMLGSAFDAEDAVQETMVRAWRSLDRFEGRSRLRSWLYRIATNVCLDMLDGRKRRARPMDLSPAAWQPVEASLKHVQPEVTWVEPMLDAHVVSASTDPAEQAVARESIRLAFVAALQHLPPRQRAVLILRDVLRYKAEEVATLLEASVVSVNSALQRARTTLSAGDVTEARSVDALDERSAELLSRYVDAFERYDMKSLVSLLHEDATQNMPPFEMWLQGRDDIITWMLGVGRECRGSRLLATTANGCPAFAQYRPSGPEGRYEPWALQVLDISDGRIAGITSFLDTSLFPLLGLPTSLDA